MTSDTVPVATVSEIYGDNASNERYNLAVYV